LKVEKKEGLRLESLRLIVGTFNVARRVSSIKKSSLSLEVLVKDSIKVLFLVAEADPRVKIGSSGDVADSLPATPGLLVADKINIVSE